MLKKIVVGDMGGAYFTKERIYEMLGIEQVDKKRNTQGLWETSFLDNVTGDVVYFKEEPTLDILVSTLKSHRERFSNSEKISKSIDGMQTEAMLKTIDTLKFKIVVLKEQLSSAISQVDVMRREINNL